MLVTSVDEFKKEVFSQLTFTPYKRQNYVNYANYTLYQNTERPELGYCMEYGRPGYYELGIADYTIPNDFDIIFDNPSKMLRFGTVYKGITTFRLEGQPVSSFKPSSFLVLEKDLHGKQVWKKGQHFHGAEITIHSAYFEEVLSSFPNCIDLNQFILNYTYHSLPLDIITIIQKMQSLAFNDQLTPIYLESKILECIAILSNEMNNTIDNSFMNQLYYGSIVVGKNRKINLTSSDIQSIKKAFDILTENPFYPPTIENLSKLVLLNEQKLKAGFHLHYHMSIGEYTNKLRMSTAANLLLTTDLSIDEIAENVGYNYSGNFTKMFKKTYGKTALQYRKENRDNIY